MADPVTAGWDALGDGRWQAARTSFEASLAIAESPEAREGSSWAAWWLDDASAVFANRERAYLLYRRRGDAADAARMATWLAADELDFRGGMAVAQGWLRRAHRLLDSLEPEPAHGWLAFHEGYVAHTSGDTTTARELGRRAAELGRRFGVADLEMLGLALEGSALVAGARVAEGMRRLDEASAAALEGQAEIPISTAWTCCFLVTACTAVLDLERAAAWCDRIAEFAARHGSRYMLAFCRAEYGAVHLWRGSWSDAEALLEAAVDDFALSRPAWVGAPLAGLAELRRRQGRTAEALELLERTGGRRALLCRARLALDRGDALRAGELAERALREIPADRLSNVLRRSRSSRMPASRVASCMRRYRRCARSAHFSTPSTPCHSERESTSQRDATLPRSPITSGPGHCSRTQSTASTGAGFPSRRRERGSSSGRCSSRPTGRPTRLPS